MDEAAIMKYVADTFDGTQTATVNGNSFFFYDPEQKFPFATLMTNDENDRASNLDRPSVFRLNIGVSKQTYRSLFGTQPLPSYSYTTNTVDDNTYDFTALDQLMPHPVYGRMYWVCILNPSFAMFGATVQPLLAEAYTMAVSKYPKPAADKDN